MSLSKVKFKRLSYNAYRMITEPDINTLYFILDKPFIYLGKVQYGLILDAQKHLINKVSFDNVTNELIIGVIGSSEEERVALDISLASELNNGLMSTEHVKKLNEVVNAVSTIDDKINKAIEEASIDPIWNEVN